MIITRRKFTLWFALLMAALILALLAATLPASASADAETYTVYATAQQFERGLMIWRADNGVVRVLHDNGYAAVYAPSYYAALPDNPLLNPPAGYVRPINAFGRIWGSSEALQTSLGWAINPEIGFNMGVTVISNTVYLTQLDGSVYEIFSNNTWHTLDTVPEIPARIYQFNVTPRDTASGTVLDMSWNIAGTHMALIEVYDGLDDTQPPVVLLPYLPLSGSQSVQLSDTLTSEVLVRLWAANRAPTTTNVTMYERVIAEDMEVTLSPDTSNTLYTRAAYQPYVNGFMIWRADTGAITVFGGTEGGPKVDLAESRYGPLPDNPFFNVPPGMVRPINGFGRVWGNFELIRRMMGWATGSEEAYTLTLTTDAQGNVTSYLLPDGRAVLVSPSFWRLP